MPHLGVPHLGVSHCHNALILTIPDGFVDTFTGL